MDIKKPLCKAVFLVSLLILVLLTGVCHGSKRVALVIGNGAYASAPLKNPVNDARDITKSLEKLGFDVVSKTNADLQAMDKAMQIFYKRLQQADVGFFYYAGHGIQIDGVNYLIPVKAQVANPSDVKYKTVAAGRILGMMKDAGNKLNIVVLDACRNNPFRSYFRSDQKGLAFMDAPDGTIVAYATSPGSVAMDGTGRNGIYTEHLLKNMGRSDLSVMQLFNRTGLDVKRATSGKQTPWMTNSPMEPYRLDGGSFVVEQPPEMTSNISDSGGTLVVTSSPAGADLYIDGSSSGTTPASLSGIKVGSVKIRVEYDGYTSEQKRVQIQSGGKSTVSFVLSRISQTGWLTVSTEPADATVRILNITPRYTRGMELDSGRYQLEVSATGYTKETSWIDLAAGEYLDIDIVLKPQAKPARADSYTDPTTGMEFVWVEGGCYQMGDTFGDGESDEKPVHEVCVDGFYIGKYEVTQGEYRSITGNNPSRFTGDRNLVEQVSWHDAQSFISKIRGRSGKNYRLPTEAEWEYAARSGGKNEKYSGSNSPDGVAWYRSNSGNSTHRVGAKTPNELGIYDMSGNVWEWCQDWYGKNYYSSSPRQNPQGASSGSDRVIRGGSWFNSPGLVRSANRNGFGPGSPLNNLGFRLVFSEGSR